ncbi:MAG: acetolactate synthase [Legionellales bacterium RIFCSPHIGHO2_12_FULL_37_14]|nr:MAG: acetolactate synthase [Legionellales bacterium RIFCSPHIGHO2_12_FULL_37_14]
MRVADYIMSFLVAQRVRHVFLLPGGGAMHLVDALGQNDELEAIPTHHEQAAGIAAEAYSRVIEHFGVLLVTTGPGGTNAITAVAGAWIESVPLLIISGQVKSADLMHDSGVRQMGVQEVDIISIVKSVTKYAVTVKSPKEVPYHLEKGVALACCGRKGPVWIDIPLDIQAARVDPDVIISYNRKLPPIERIKKPTMQLEEIVAHLSIAQRPLIFVGHGVRLAGAADTFRKLLEEIEIPVVATWNAMDLLHYDHPLYVGSPGVVALRAPNFAIQNCDLLIAIGTRLDKVLTAYNWPGFAREAKKIVIDIDAHEILKFQTPPDLAVLADAGDFLDSLLTKVNDLKLVNWNEWIMRCSGWKRRYSLASMEPFESNKGEIRHLHFVDAFSQQVPEGSLIVTGSSGLAVEAFYTAFRNKPDQRIFLTAGLGSMGYGLPAAIGACIGLDRKKTVAVEGDGSLQLNVQELATMKGLDLPIILFVLNNRGYASIRNTQRNYFDGRYVATGPEAGLHFPDLQDLAQGYGIASMRIEEPDQMSQQIYNALQHKGPFICEVMLKPNEALYPKVTAIPQADGSMLSMPLEDMSPLLPLDVLKKEMVIPLAEASLLQLER